MNILKVQQSMAFIFGWVSVFVSWRMYNNNNSSNGNTKLKCAVRLLSNRIDLTISIQWIALHLFARRHYVNFIVVVVVGVVTIVIGRAQCIFVHS